MGTSKFTPGKGRAGGGGGREPCNDMLVYCHTGKFVFHMPKFYAKSSLSLICRLHCCVLGQDTLLQFSVVVPLFNQGYKMDAKKLDLNFVLWASGITGYCILKSEGLFQWPFFILPQKSPKNATSYQARHG